jgi:hypothetical protein
MVVVKDRIMGSGKTYDAIEWMRDTNEKFVYITPFLSEVERVLENVNAYEPTTRNEDGSKKSGLLNLMSNGLNVVSTHSCFKSLNNKDYDEKFNDYVLILDEVVEPLEILSISHSDIEILVNSNRIKINEDTSVDFIDEEYIGKFNFLKDLCNTSNVFLVSDTFLVWNFPVEIFKSFKKIEILTYLFEGSILSSYFKANNISYKVDKIDDSKQKEVIKGLLNIYDGQSNDIGNKITSLSVNWFSNNKSNSKKISFTTTNIFTRVFKTKSEQNAFTTFKDYMSSIKGAGYSKGFIPVNSRATNNFSEKKSMAYLANRYYNPTITQFFEVKGVETNQDLWALGELLQWVWRGCIRNNEPMNLYVPSKRMRTLLINWLNNEI